MKPYEEPAGGGCARRRRRFEEPGDLFPDFAGDRHRPEILLRDADENVSAARDQARRVRLAADLEVEVDRRPPDPAEVRLDRKQLVELDGQKEVALDAHARQPDAQHLEEETVVQPGGPQQLRFGEPEESEVRLVVDDARGVNVLPADVLLDCVAGHGERLEAPEGKLV